MIFFLYMDYANRYNREIAGPFFIDSDGQCGIM